MFGRIDPDEADGVGLSYRAGQTTSQTRSTSQLSFYRALFRAGEVAQAGPTRLNRYPRLEERDHIESTE